MRAILMTVLTLSLSGCLFGAGRSQTTTTFVDDPGDGPVHRQTYSTNSSGMNVGGSVPLMMGAGGGMYGGGMMYAGGGMYGGGNTACVLHPDRCAVIQTATVVQPISISSSGGGFAGGGSGRSAGDGAVATDDSELTAMLAKHEKVISIVAGGTKQNSRQICQIIVGYATKMLDDGDKTIITMIPDVDERKEVIGACQDFLTNHPYTKTAKTEAK